MKNLSQKVGRDAGARGSGGSFRGNSDAMQKGVSGKRTREEREARITRMMLIVFGCFLMCYLPLFIYLRVILFRIMLVNKWIFCI